jgi:hypothetical protein
MRRCDVRLKREAGVPVLRRRVEPAVISLWAPSKSKYVARGHLRGPAELARNAEHLRLYILLISVLASGRPL